MSKTERFLILDTQNAAAGGDKVEKAAGHCPHSATRRTLADISNLPQKPRPLIQDEKSLSIQTTAKAYIEQLQKENMALVKMLAQRNKIIEQSGIELERLRLHLIKVQEQNQQLALSHTQMLAELNFGKDRLKALQHELGCKTGLLKARKLKGGNTCRVPCPSADPEVNVIKLREEGETSTVGRDNEKPRNTKRRLRSQSLGSSEPLQSEENTGNRRPSVRRQSARFKAVESKPVEDLSEKDDTKFPECPLPGEPVLENGSTSKSTLVKNVNVTKLREEEETSIVVRDDEKPRNTKRRLGSQKSFIGLGSSEALQSQESAGNIRPSVRRQSARFKAVESKSAEDPSEKDHIKLPERPLADELMFENESTSISASVKYDDNKSSSGLEYESQEVRSSLCRPSRVASRKVQSYKEIPLNIKMRRSE